LAHDISIYSPHTTIDAVAGGMNDRVIEALSRLRFLISVCGTLTDLPLLLSKTLDFYANLQTNSDPSIAL